VLRDEWGFDGIVVSDWGSVFEMVIHGYATDPAHAAVLALEAGVDIDMESRAYGHVPAAIAAGRIETALVDAAVRRVLTAKFALGLFDRPYVDESLADRALHSAEHVRIAREVARDSIVLLENKDQVLPLAADGGQILVIGPLADSPADQMGSWIAAGARGDSVTPLVALRNHYGSRRAIHFVPGVAPEATPDDSRLIDEAVSAAAAAEVVLLFVGERANMSGEARSRANLDLPGRQSELVERLAAAARPLVLILQNGRPLAIPREVDHATAVVEAWFGGSQAGPALVDILTGAASPSGRLPMTFPRSAGQVPLYHNAKSNGRPALSRYEDIDNAPLFPFGHGLTYTTFAYGELRLDAPTITRDGQTLARITLTNTGLRSGTEIVQLYIRDLVGSTTRPVRELRGYQRATLAPSESRELVFPIGHEQLSLLDSTWRAVLEPGDFDVQIGPHAGAGPTVRLTVRSP
jgi:beta-glucosidase